VAKKKKPSGGSKKTKGEAEKSKDKAGKTPKPKAKSKAKAEASVAAKLPILMIVEIVVAIGVLVLLCFVVNIYWLGALSIASALFVFLDAAIHHVNRIKPTSKESRLGLLVWSLAGFVPFAGVAAYVALRKKLASAPTAKITTSMEAVETVKSRMRMVSIPTAIVVGVIAVAIAWRSLPGPFTIEFGTKWTGSFRMQGTASNGVYSGTSVSVKLVSKGPIEGRPNLDWKLFCDGVHVPYRNTTARVATQSDITIWVWRVPTKETGDYSLHVMDHTGKILKRGYFTVRR